MDKYIETPRFLALAGMVLAAGAMRLVPHPPNFTPLTAMALFGGAAFTDKRIGIGVSLAALFLSDLALGFHALIPVVYGSFALIACLGFALRGRRAPWRVAAAAFGGSALFFVLTNLGVWAFGSLYPRTLEGLALCYGAALPFWRNALAGDALYCAALFGSLAFAERRFPGLRELPARA